MMRTGSRFRRLYSLITRAPRRLKCQCSHLIYLASFETPSPTTPTGAKGAGELSIISPPAVLANALADAIDFPEGIKELPLTSERVYKSIKKARGD